MSGDDVHLATTEDLDRLVAPIVLAFSTDPLVRYLLPGPTEYSVTFPEIVRIHAETVVEHGGSYRSQDFRGAALWYPPGVHPDGEAISAIFSEVLDERAQETLHSLLLEMGAFGPDEAHMYLRMIGVDPVLQGRGYGSALIRAALDECDRRDLPAYLEATSPGSRGLYERHDFTVIGEVQVADAPPLWPMLRPARS